MDKNLPNDPLEDFFKKSLEGMDDLPSDDGWDMPSADLWGRVEENIQPPTATVRSINYWKWTAIAASFTVLILAYQFFNQEQQINELTTELNENVQELDAAKELLENKNSEIESAIVEKNNPNQNLQNVKPTLKTENEKIVKNEERQNAERKNYFSDERESLIGGKNNDGIPSIPSNQNQNIVQNNSENNVLVFSSENKLNQKDKIPSKNDEAISDNSNNTKEKVNLEIENLPSRVFVTNISDDKMNHLFFENENTHLASIELVPEFPSRGIYFGGYLSKNQGMRKIQSGNSNLGKIRKNVIEASVEEELWTVGGGIKLGYQFNNRWSIETGIQYSKAKINSKQKIEKEYTSDSEVVDPLTGELENDYVLSIVTPIGDVGSDVTLSRPSIFMIQEESLFNIELSSTQNIEFLGIPILAKYSIGNKKFNVGLKAGVLANFTLDSDVEIQKVDNPFPMFRHRKHQIKDKSELKDLKSTTIDFMTGVEASVRINSNVSFTLEPSFSRSLTPIFEKKDVKTFPMMANVKVGMNYHF